MFANPGLLETQSVEPFDFLKIPALAIADAGLGKMRWHE
jgi:hypothetical protein